MANGFDGYYKWLGIPPSEQPPNHYRLLGLGIFESDPDVIQAAADRQMAHLQTYKNGPQAELSQKLLNEVATAKLCLLKPAKKTSYDEQLRQQGATVAQTVHAGVAAARPAMAGAAAQNGGGAAAGAALKSGPMPVVPPDPPRPVRPPPVDGDRPAWPLAPTTAVLIAALVLVLALAIGIAVAMTLRNSPVTNDATTSPGAASNTQGNNATTDPSGKGAVPPAVKTVGPIAPPVAPTNVNPPATNVLGQPVDKKPSHNKPNEPPDPFATQKGGNSTVASPDKANTKTVASATGPSGVPDKTAPPKVGPDKTAPPVKPPAGAGSRQIVPDEAALAAADAELALALPNPTVADLVQQAQQASGGPAIYAALHKAIELAVKGADVAGANGAAEQICKRFTVDELELRSQTLEGLRATVREPIASGLLAQTAVDLIDEAVAANRPKVAEALAETSLAAARHSGDNELIKKVTLRILKMRQPAT